MTEDKGATGNLILFEILFIRPTMAKTVKSKIYTPIKTRC